MNPSGAGHVSPFMKPLIFAFVSIIALGCSSADFEIATSEGSETQADAEQDGSTSIDSSDIDTGIEQDTSPQAFDTSITTVDSATLDGALDTGTSPKDTGTTGCMSPAGCPSGTECQFAACTTGTCSLTNKPTTATCSGGKCNGAGKCVQCVSGSDCATGNCDPSGHCVECLTASTCPAPSGECKVATCIAGKCGVGPKPSGSFCHGFDDQCDGFGNCVDCVNNGGCGECCVCTANACTPA